MSTTTSTNSTCSTMATGTLGIRRAERKDVATIMLMIRALADYEHAPHSVKIAEPDLLRDGFDTPTPLFRVYICEDSVAGPVGFALVFNTYSTWEGPVLYLEDLFVLPEHRHRGAGKLLFRAVASEAQTTHCARLVWQVLDWNEPSRRWYEQYCGGKAHTEWITYRMYASDIAAFLAK